MNYDFVCLGDAIYDIFIKPHEVEVLDSCKKSRIRVACEPLLCFGYGEKISISKVNTTIGGSSANVAVGLSRLNLKTSLISQIGSDNAAFQVESQLQKEKVDLSHICRVSGQNSFSLVLMHKKERTVLVYKAIKDYSLLKFPKNIKSKWFYLSSLGDKYEEVYKKIINLVSQKGIILALNPGKKELSEKKKEFLSLLRICEVLILNKEEAEFLIGARFPLNPKEMFFRLSEFGAKINVVTDGKNGAYAKNSNGEIYKIDKFSDIETLDATGAGDAFSSAFLYQLWCVRKTNRNDYTAEDIQNALAWGVINGAKVTEKIGTQAGLQTKSQLEKLAKNAPSVYKL